MIMDTYHLLLLRIRGVLVDYNAAAAIFIAGYAIMDLPLYRSRSSFL